MKRYFIIILLFLNQLICNSKNYTISGFIEDSITGERLIGANIFNEKTGTISNEYGYFCYKTSTLPINITFSFIGYQSQKHSIQLEKDTNLIIKLVPSIEIKEVKIFANKTLDLAQTGRVNIPIKLINNLPVIFGETDILKIIQLMPGVQGGIDGFSGIYVRGGSADQNLILLDGAPVYNINHLFGMFSVFNTDGIASSTLFKSGFPARYSGRASSVLDIRMKEGNLNQWQGNASIGLISSKALIEGPLIPKKTSMLFSIRRSYIDLLSTLYFKITEPGYNIGYNFNDWNLKLNHQINLKNKIYLSSYFGRDNFFQSEIEKSPLLYYESKKKNAWGNQTLTSRWNHLFNNSIFSNLSLIYSQYSFYFEDFLIEKDVELNIENKYDNKLESSVKEVTINYDIDYQLNEKNKIKTGFHYSFQEFKPNITGDFSLGIEGKTNLSSAFGDEKKYLNIAAFHFEDEWFLSKKIILNIGLRNSILLIKSNHSLYFEPRLNVNYKITPLSSLKASYCRVSQFIHLLTNTGAGFPTDLWIPSTVNVKPLTADLFSINYSQKIGTHFILDIEAYYKNYKNLTEYKDLIQTLNNTSWETLVEQGKGISKGLDVSFDKTEGKISGWIGYGYLISNRSFPVINKGKPFPFKYARKHTFNTVITYKISDKFEIGAVWVFYSGFHITLPDSYYRSFQWYNDFNDSRFNTFANYTKLNYIKNRNNYTTPPYHRLDISLKYYKNKKNINRSWSAGIYNIYCNPNPMVIIDDGDKIEVYSYLMFMPFINYNIKF